MLKQPANAIHPWLTSKVDSFDRVRVVRHYDEQDIRHLTMIYEEYNKLIGQLGLNWKQQLIAQVNMKETDNLFLLAYDRSENELAGYLIAVREKEYLGNLYDSSIGCVTVTNLFVTFKHQRKGIGSELLSYMLQYAEYNCIYVTVPHKFEEDGERFLAYMGFHPKQQTWTWR